MEKSQLRKEYFRQHRNHKKDEDQGSVLEGLQKNIRRFFRNKRSLKIMAYDPLPSELPILSCIKKLNLEIEVFIPVVKSRTILPVSQITGKFEKMHKMDYIIVPGLFVNEAGYRLGRGKGYYDRILGSYPRFRSIFVCRSWQVLKDLPTDPWDKRVGFIITEHHIRMCI